MGFSGTASENVNWTVVEPKFGNSYQSWKKGYTLWPSNSLPNGKVHKNLACLHKETDARMSVAALFSIETNGNDLNV